MATTARARPIQKTMRTANVPKRTGKINALERKQSLERALRRVT
jgi:hypothetical protein